MGAEPPFVEQPAASSAKSPTLLKPTPLDPLKYPSTDLKHDSMKYPCRRLPTQTTYTQYRTIRALVQRRLLRSRDEERHWRSATFLALQRSSVTLAPCNVRGAFNINEVSRCAPSNVV